MKRYILAAAVLAAAAGSAFARGDGGCVKKPGQPKPGARAWVRVPVRLDASRRPLARAEANRNLDCRKQPTGCGVMTCGVRG